MRGASVNGFLFMGGSPGDLKLAHAVAEGYESGGWYEGYAYPNSYQANVQRFCTKPLLQNVYSKPQTNQFFKIVTLFPKRDH